MYSSEAEITAAFGASQWDPNAAGHEPGAATVADWLATESAVLDGQIAHVVTTPVSEADSPKLHAVCSRVVALRVRAEVYDTLFPPSPDDDQHMRRSAVWRKTAGDLVKGIAGGAVADGTLLSGRYPDAPSAPVGHFGADDTRFGSREREW